MPSLDLSRLSSALRSGPRRLRSGQRRLRSSQRRLPPGPPGLPLLGSVVDVYRDVLGAMSDGLRDYGDTVRYRFGPYDMVVVHKPEDIRAVLLERAGDMHKSPSYRGIELVLGKGLLTSEGEFWRRQRKLMTPAFHHERLVGFCDTMVACAGDLAQTWLDAIARDEQRGAATILDVHAQMLALTFRIVGLTLFSTELADDAGKMGPALATLVEHANFVAVTLLLAPPPWVPTARNRRFRAAKQIVDDVVLGIIASRRRTGEDPGDLLGMLMAATDEDSGVGMTDAELRDEIATLVLAGHETTAQALTFTLMLLSRHPEIERRVVAEIREVCGSRPPGYGDLEALVFTGHVIDEALRLYPPAWLFEREAQAPVEVDGYVLAKGSLLAVCPWTLHRHPAYWRNPEGFDPARFEPARSKQRPRYTYLPFGGGPRTCIGVNFALYEAKLVLATLLQRVAFELVPGQDLSLRAEVTLRPAHGMRMRLREREV